MSSQEILFDTFAASGGRAILTGDLLSNNRRVLVGTDAADIGFNHLIGKFLGRFGRHRQRMLYFDTCIPFINFYCFSGSMGTTG